MRKKLTLLLCFISFALLAQAQNTDEWEENYDETEEMYIEEGTNLEDIYEQLSELKSAPINLNTATRKDLERFPFLTAQQIEDLSEYLYHYAPIRSWGELAMIESLDERKRKLIQQFTYLGEKEKLGFPHWKEMLKWGKQELMGYAKIPYYNRKGDRSGYLGHKYKHGLRYKFGYGDYLQMGFVAAQDAGEPFLAQKNKGGYDYYSFYAQIKKRGKINALVLGKYRVRHGMGLVINNDWLPSKVAAVDMGGRIVNTLKGHSSRSSSNYLQGMACALQIAKHWEASFFISYRPIDTSLGNDSASIRSILTTGYHRTENEMQRKNNSTCFLTGSNIHFSHKGFKAGLTAIYYTFDKPLYPNRTQIYRWHEAHGKSFCNIGVNYGYNSKQLNLSGETAMDRNKALATINTASYRVNSQLSFTLLQRFYSYRYQALFARSFSDGGSTQNESGVYLGASWHPVKPLVISLYADYAHSPWPRYQRSISSQAWDYNLAATYTHHHSTFYMRYRIRNREKDNEEKTTLIPHREHRIRLAWNYNTTLGYAKTQMDMTYSSYKKASKGWMITQSGGLKIGRTQWHGHLSYFRTDDFQSRIYNYERSTRYHFSFPSYYGHGMRYALLAQIQAHQNFRIIIKGSNTQYFDRKKIGNGLQEVDGKSIPETDIQLIWRF